MDGGGRSGPVFWGSAFSKRTDVYLNVAYIRNKDGSELGTGDFGTTVAGKNQAGAVLGVRHKF